MGSIRLKPPIFLLGNVRSGTSMMHDFFDLHPAVVSWYEPRTIWTYAAPARRHDRFDEHDATPRVTKYIRRRFLQYQEAHGGLRIMEKTPSNMFRIPYVHAIFPEARYIYMVREPLANLSSSELRWRKSINRNQFLNRLHETPRMQLPFYFWRFVEDKIRKKLLRRKHVSIWGVRYPGIQRDLRQMTVEEVIAKQWVACSRQAESDLAAIDPALVLRMRYEDFVADPVNQFERILDHFNLDFPASLRTHITQTVDPNRQMKWTRLDPEVLRRCIPILREEMDRHNYDIPDALHEAIASGEAHTASQSTD